MLLAYGARRLLAERRFSLSRAFIPAGTIPPPAAWPRSLRARAARSRRYWQIVRIFTRCGVQPLGRGPRSVSLARSLSEALDRSGVLFVKFGQPLAAASIAQVHAACLHTGERVVVKVLRPGVASLVERDLDIIARLARRTEARAAWARAIGVVNLAEGFAAALREELDFRVEAGNLA